MTTVTYTVILATHREFMVDNFTTSSDVLLGSFLEISSGTVLAPSKTASSQKVVGVASTKVNGEVTVETSGIQWARVVGKIKPGDSLMTTTITGVASVASCANAFNVVALALDPYDSDRIGTIRVWLK